MKIQHNLWAMNANRNIKINTGKSAKTTEKLSSGYRINRAADDAAGLSISEKMRRLIRGLTQASRNCQDGISMVQTAEGALHEVHDMLQRMNELAVQSANGTNAEADREALQQEFAQIQDEIDRVSQTTTFNAMRLFADEDSSTGTTNAGGTNGTNNTNGTGGAIGTNNSNTPSVTGLDETQQQAPVMRMMSLRSTARAVSSITVDELILTGDNLVEGVDYTYDSSTMQLTILTDKDITISNLYSHLTGQRIAIADGVNANITLNNVNIEAWSNVVSGLCAFRIDGSATCNLTLLGENVLWSMDGQAGLQVNENASLVITKASTGKLTATSGNYGAGIGGGGEMTSGKITINGGEIIANGGAYSAGIGGGVNRGCSSIIINGGKVTATGGTGAAGIGGGSGGSNENCNIEINGGTITATGNGAGIGGGNGGSGGIINISGGTVTANGGDGAGIGGGAGASGGDIDISGGNITATGSTGAGIGGGNKGSGGDIDISGGAIHATSSWGTGIGGGAGASGGNISISDGDITANGGNNSAGIGGGAGTGTSGGNIDISGGKVTATGGSNGAGIGGGDSGAGGTIDISGGTIEATAGSGGGAGIGGGGSGASGGDITISSGTVTATGGTGDYYGTAFGGYGIGGSGGTFTTTSYGDATINATGGAGMAAISDTSDQANWTGTINGTTYDSSFQIGSGTIDLSTLTGDLVIENGGYKIGDTAYKWDGPLTLSGTTSHNVTVSHDATINLTGDASVGGLTVASGKTLTIGGSGDLTFTGALDNQGTINNTPTIYQSESGSITNMGSITGKAVLRSDGSIDITNLSGTVEITSTGFKANGQEFGYTGDFYITGNNANVDLVINTGKAVNINMNSVTGKSLTVSGNSTANINLSGTSTMNDVTVASGSTLNTSGSGTLKVSGTLDNDGTISNSSGVTIENNGTFDNSGRLNNSGVFDSSGGSITSVGTVSGTPINMGQGSGNIDLSTLTDTLTITDTGYKIGGVSYIYDGDYVFTGTTSHSLNMQSDANITFEDVTCNVGFGMWGVGIEVNVTIVGDNNYLAGLTVANDSTLNLLGNGTLTVRQSADVYSGCTLNIGENVTFISERYIGISNSAEINNEGTFNNNGSLYNYGELENSGEVNNGSGGTINNQSGDIKNNEGGTITNNGNITGNDYSSITNNGTIDNTGGSIKSDGEVTGSGGISGNPVEELNPTLQGDGVINLNDVTDNLTITSTGYKIGSQKYTYSGPYTLTGSTTGNINVYSDATINMADGTSCYYLNVYDGSTANLVLNGTTTMEKVIVEEGSTLNISGPGTLKVTNDSVENAGTLNIGSGSTLSSDWRIDNTGTINNNGTIDNNSGTLDNKTGGVIKNNTGGVIDTTDGTFWNYGTTANEGAINGDVRGNAPTAPASRVIDLSTLTGDLEFTSTGYRINGTDYIGSGPYTLSGTTMRNITISDDVTINLTGDASVRNLTVESGKTLTLGGSSPLTFTGALDNQGTIANTAALQQGSTGTITSMGTITGKTIWKGSNSIDLSSLSSDLTITGTGYKIGEQEYSQSGALTITGSDQSRNIVIDCGGSLTGSGNRAITLNSVNGGNFTVTGNSAVDVTLVGTSEVENLNVEEGSTFNTSGTGTIKVRTKLDNDGTVNNGSGSTIENDGTLDNTGGTINNSGTLDNDGTVNNGSGGTINNQGGGTIDNGRGSTINNGTGGQIANSGDLNNADGGTVNNTGGGQIDNTGTVDNGGTLNNGSGSTINNGTGGQITNGGTVNNADGGTVNNTGGGQIDNTGSVDNGGTLNNGSGSTINNENGGQIDNTGNVDNSGTLDNGGTLNNSGTVKNNTGGSIDNTNGTFNNTSGEVKDNGGTFDTTQGTFTGNQPTQGSGSGTGDGTGGGTGGGSGSGGTGGATAGTAKNSWWIQAGAEAGEGINIEIGAMNTKVLGIDKGTVNILTQESSGNAITAVSGAIEKLSEQRSRLGAYQNRLEHTIRNLDNVVENTTYAESRIRDADMAELMVEHANNNIIMQAAQAMLAQANHQPDGVLQLLQ